MKENYLAPDGLRKDLQIFFNGLEENPQQLFKAMMWARHTIVTIKRTTINAASTAGLTKPRNGDGLQKLSLIPPYHREKES